MALTINSGNSSVLKNKKGRGVTTQALTYAYMTVVRW